MTLLNSQRLGVSRGDRVKVEEVGGLGSINWTTFTDEKCLSSRKIKLLDFELKVAEGEPYISDRVILEVKTPTAFDHKPFQESLSSMEFGRFPWPIEYIDNHLNHLLQLKFVLSKVLRIH